MRKIWNKILLLITVLAISIFSHVWAYNYSFDNRALSIEDTFKSKVDLFVDKKILTKETANKYITALQKINYERLNSSKQSIYDYLYFKLKSFGAIEKTVNSTNIVSSTSSINSTSLTPGVPNTTYVNYPDSKITFSSNYEKDYIGELQKHTKDIVSVDSKLIFNRNWKQYLLKSWEHYVVDINKPVNLYLNIPTLNDEILIEKWGKFYISSWWYSFEQKLEINDIKSKVILYSESTKSSLFSVVDWYYYAYNLYNYVYIPIPTTWIFLSQYSPISDLSKDILLYNDWKYYLIIAYETVKLFKSNLLDNISNKEVILWYYSNNLYAYTQSDIEIQLNYIKDKSIELTQNTWTSDEKISNIYAWITANIKYDNFSIDFIKWKYSEDYFNKNVNNEVFSGIWAYKNKVWVCNWYSHLFLYMLYFAGIENVSIEPWQSLIKWKRISHAWNKIWDYYYDVTWDIDSLGDKSKFHWYKASSDDFFKLRRKL